MSSTFKVLLLGTNSALPQHNRFPTSQVLYFDNHLFLIDCGEGTQLRLAQNKVKRNKISHIFISHLHGDHVYGLPGLIGSFNHYNRKDALTVYGPPGIKRFLETTFSISSSFLNFPIDIIELSTEEKSIIVIDKENQVTSFPMKHRIPTIGYRFNHISSRIKIKKEAIAAYKLNIAHIKSIVKGEPIETDGRSIDLNEVSYEKKQTKSYAYCSDTMYDEDLIPYIQGADLLYHETTYLDGLEKEAEIRKHSTLGQAIIIAKKAKAGKLLTGHYSSRYENLSEFYKVANDSSYPILIGEDHKSYFI